MDVIGLHETNSLCWVVPFWQRIGLSSLHSAVSKSCISKLLVKYFTTRCLLTYASAARFVPLGSSYFPIAHNQEGHLVCLYRYRHLDRRCNLPEP